MWMKLEQSLGVLAWPGFSELPGDRCQVSQIGKNPSIQQ